MKWEVIAPPVYRVIDWALAKAHCKIDSDTEQVLVEGYIDAATEFAEDTTESSLVERTIQATYYEKDTYYHPQCLKGAVARLPRGPLIEVVSVTDANEKVITDYEIERRGLTDLIRVKETIAYPLTVTYTAGYTVGSEGNDIPQVIKQAILVHAGMLYANRESFDMPSLDSLRSFYQLKRRGVGIG